MVVVDISKIATAPTKRSMFLKKSGSQAVISSHQRKDKSSRNKQGTEARDLLIHKTFNYKASFGSTSNLQNDVKDVTASTPKVKKYREPEPEPRKDASNTPPPPEQLTFDG